ncbi:MAG: PilZ domain-containing protein [Lachnospiraceae bacterium]|nr:PilZ domain-containing protein [Lachnospiraceae bacterium]
MSHLIETGTKLELIKIRHIETKTDISYISRFLYQKSVDEAVIEMPTKAGVLVPLEPGETFQVCFYTSKGLYQCQAQVISRHYENSLPVAVIKLRSEFEKLQRRQYYRMECILQLEFATVTEEEMQNLLMQKSTLGNQIVKRDGADVGKREPQMRFYPGVTLDISGGGVRFNSEHAAQSGDIIAMRIAFLSPDTQRLKILFARVLTVLSVPNRNGLYEHRVEFVSLPNAERECLIRYIFLEERKRRKREAGIE